MKYIIEYYEIKSDHLLAKPEFDRQEIVEVNSIKKLNRYIMSKKDMYGNKFKIVEGESKKLFMFDYISNQGAIKIKKYHEPNIKRIY